MTPPVKPVEPVVGIAGTVAMVAAVFIWVATVAVGAGTFAET